MANAQTAENGTTSEVQPLQERPGARIWVQFKLLSLAHFAIQLHPCYPKATASLKRQFCHSLPRVSDESSSNSPSTLPLAAMFRSSFLPKTITTDS